MKKFLCVVILTVLVFLSGAVLGVSTVFRVGYVALTASTVTENAAAEAENLQTRLQEAYEKKSIFFSNEETAQEILKEFPAFRLSRFEKEYPNLLFIEVAEDAEIYALECSDGTYAILGENGTVLDIRDGYINSLTGEENVVLKGLYAQCTVGEQPALDDRFGDILAFCDALSEELGGIRRNVVSVEVFLRVPETIFCATMREGVKIYVGEPSVNTEEKVALAIEKYRSLSSAEKMSGRIVVSENKDGIFASYDGKDL